MGIIIDNAGDCTVKKFMDCCFAEKYKVLVIEGDFTEEEKKRAFELIYAEYVDLAGLYQTKEFEMYAYVTSLDQRITTITKFILLQKEFINQFGLPFITGFGIVKKYGHNLYWDFNNPDLPAFFRKLDQIAVKEAKYTSLRDGKIKELLDMRKKKVNNEHNPLQSKKDFITMLNRLQQNKFVIDKEKTSMEDLALMIADSREQTMEAEAQKRMQKHR